MSVSVLQHFHARDDIDRAPRILSLVRRLLQPGFLRTEKTNRRRIPLRRRKPRPLRRLFQSKLVLRLNFSSRLALIYQSASEPIASASPCCASNAEQRSYASISFHMYGCPSRSTRGISVISSFHSDTDHSISFWSDVFISALRINNKNHYSHRSKFGRKEMPP